MQLGKHKFCLAHGAHFSAEWYVLQETPKGQDINLPVSKPTFSQVLWGPSTELGIFTIL